MSERYYAADSPEGQMVERYGVAMSERLNANAWRGKTGWQWMTPKQLLRRAEQELGELA